MRRHETPGGGVDIHHPPEIPFLGFPDCHRLLQPSERELFGLRLPALADDADVLLEGLGGRVVGEAGFVLPRFAEQEDAGARGTLENIVGDAAGVRVSSL